MALRRTIARRETTRTAFATLHSRVAVVATIVRPKFTSIALRACVLCNGCPEIPTA